MAVVCVAPCWLRVILRPEEKTDAESSSDRTAAGDTQESERRGEETYIRLRLYRDTTTVRRGEERRGEERRHISN